MSVFLLTWNPSKYLIDDEEYEGRVTETLNGDAIEGRWSIGTRTHGVDHGDHALLVRQRSERGIVASGRFEHGVYQDAHWERIGT